MVSIPDWSRLKHLFNEPVGESASLTERYKKIREIDAVKKAELTGLFIKLDKKYIDEHFATDVFASGHSILNKYDTPEKDYSGIYFIYRPGHFIRSVKDVYVCQNLTICVLSNNYITKIHALMQCKLLQKLDLHNNQITLVPPSHYWYSLSRLRYLLLHGNPIALLDNVHEISGTQSIIALTMYDTPLSLKKNYRHHVVNSVTTLKVLDLHVISDEEIIEDAHFGDIFGTMHPNFEIDVCPAVPKGFLPTFDDEQFCIKVITQQINFIQAHCSPVLIIQRFIRGFLLRKKMGIKNKTFFLTSLRMGASPIVPAATPPPDELGIVDYDNYPKSSRRPVSQPGSEFSVGSVRPLTSEMDGHRAPQPSATMLSGEKRRVFVNFAKLENETLRNLHDEHELTTELMQQRVILGGREDTFLSSWKEKMKSRQQPAGETEEDEALPRVNFRLKGFKPNIHHTDYYVSELKQRKMVARSMRKADIHFHLSEEPKPTIPYQPPKNTYRRNMHTAQTTMNMSPIWAVHRAYKERDRLEKTAARSAAVSDAKESRDTAKHRISLYQEDRRQKAQQEREHDQRVAAEILEKRERARQNYLEKSQAQREKRSQQSKRRMGEHTFIHDFSTQNTSVSNALLRHDRLARREDTKQGKSALVQNTRDSMIEHNDVVKKYLEHRQLLRQTEAAMSRAAIDTRMLQEANERLMEAKVRVAQQKARSATVEQFYPLPDYKTQTLPPMDKGKVSGMQGLDRYYTSVFMTSGHVGKHPPLYSY